MISKSDIETLIDKLDILYTSCGDPDFEIYYSKFALLELCGWIELAMDDIIKSFSAKNISDPANINLVEKEIIGKTWGFRYEEHFRPMLIKSLGLWFLEQIQADLNAHGELDKLRGELSILWDVRKKAAHTSVTGVTLSFDAPNVTKNRLIIIFPILQSIETKIL
jgi:hypothetical protein